MIESGGGIIPIELFYPFKMINKGFKKVKDSSINKNEIIGLAKTFDNSVKGSKNFFGTGITLTDNEIKDIKIIQYVENRGILLKLTTKKNTRQEGGFLNFLRRLMTAGLPLMKSVVTPLAKSILLPLGFSVGISVADAAVKKKIYVSGSTTLIILNEEIKDI